MPTPVALKAGASTLSRCTGDAIQALTISRFGLLRVVVPTFSPASV
jgi:hypothetical protein